MVSSGRPVLSGDAAGDTDSGTDRGGFFSGGGMVQLDALLSQFAGVVSGFDLGSETRVACLFVKNSSGACLSAARRAPPVRLARQLLGLG